MIKILCAFLVCVSGFFSLELSADPYKPIQTINSEDFARQMALGDISSDWSQTDLYDLYTQTELRVILQDIEIPDGGVARVLFTMDLHQEVMDKANWESNHLFYAVLQISDEVNRKGFTHGSFGQGKDVILRGWPPTERNTSGSMMLVEEIQFGNGELYRFHDANPNIKKKLK